MKKIYKRIRLLERVQTFLVWFSKIRYVEFALLLCILAGGFGVRLYKINNPIADWHSWRQADTASVSKSFIERGYDLILPRYHDVSTIQTGLFNPEGLRLVEFPLYNAYHAVFYELFPSIPFEVWGRLISIFAALGSAIVLFCIGRDIGNKWIGLLASGIYLIIPYNIYFTRVILPEPFAVFWGLLALYVFLLFEKNNKYSYLFLSSILFCIALLVKPYIIFYGLVPGISLLKKDGLKKILTNKKYWVAFLIAFIPLAAWRMWIRQFPEGIPFWKWTFNGDEIRFKPSYWYWIFGQRLGNLILGIGGLVPFSFALLVPRKKYLHAYTFILAQLAYVVVIATANVKHDYYQTMTIPAISLIVAIGVYEIFVQKSDYSWLPKIVATFSLGLMVLLGLMQVREYYKINNPAIMSAGAAVDRLTEKDAWVIAPYNGDTAFLYQTGRWGWPYVDRPLRELIEEGADYFVSVNFSDPQTIQFSEEYVVLEKTNEYVILDLHQKQQL